MDDLIARFDLAVADQWGPHLAPTAESIAAVEKHFGVRLPALLVELARKSKSFSSFFLGIGPNFHSHTHMVEKNRMVRTNEDWLRLDGGRSAPSNLVFITENFMDSFFWCLDTETDDPAGTVVYWEPCSRVEQPSFGFHSFLEAQIQDYEHRKR